MLSADKVRLRPIEKRDLATLYLWMQDADLLRSINRTEKTTWSSHIDWYRRLLRDESQILFSVEAVEDGMLVGQCGLKKLDYKNRKAELWIFIGDSTMRGKGYRVASRQQYEDFYRLRKNDVAGLEKSRKGRTPVLRRKVLAYWGEIKELKSEGIGFRKIAEYLFRKRKVRVSWVHLSRIWKEVEQ